MEQGRILDIKHFAVHDGDGIRTTVFLKGCPLKCVWCHNPESIGFAPELGYVSRRCVNCGECVQNCEAHSFVDGVHRFDRRRCSACGKCVSGCLGGALTMHGRMMTSEEVFREVYADKDFYANSGGGMTLSGGECLMQYRFCRELLGKCKENCIHTAVDTCGFVAKEAIDAVSPYTDIFLYDMKAFDEEVHIKCTGQSNQAILENLRYIDSLHIPVEIRIPFVPDYNDGQIEKIAAFLKELTCVKAVKLLGYHNMAGTKYEAVGLTNTMPKKMPTKEQLDKAEAQLRDAGLCVKR